MNAKVNMGKKVPDQLKLNHKYTAGMNLSMSTVLQQIKERKRLSYAGVLRYALQYTLEHNGFDQL